MVDLFGNIHIDWLGKRKIFFAITILLILIGGVSLVTKGKFVYGVDFKGGTIVRVKFKQAPDVARIRAALPSDASVQGIATEPNEYLIEYESSNAADITKSDELITKALDVSFAGQYDVRSRDYVGAKVGSDLRQQAVFATLYALGGILVYIAFRFEWIYGAAAVFAVFHDTLITLGLFSLFNRPINLTVIAALLTLVGYSVNDTIVVFDRVRENLKIRRRDDLETILNDSINQTLSRTVVASGLTFMTVVALFVFGGEIISHFAFAMVIGIVIGTYSSIAIAAPLVLIYTNLTGTNVRQAVSTTKMPKLPKGK